VRWLKHLSMAHADEAIADLLERHGAEAYGVWWLILEDISAPMEPGKMLPTAAHSAVKWSQICHCSVRVWRSIANSLAEKKLIVMQSTDNRIRIDVPNILKYKDEYSKKSGQTPEQEHIQIQIQRESREKAEEPPPQTPPAAVEVSLVPTGRFPEWWGMWTPVMGTNHQPQALRSYAKFVTSDLEQVCFECTRSYLASRGDRNGGYNPENFLRDQARDGFVARWPAWKRPFDKADRNQERRERVNRMAKVLGQKWP
jgi:hypothetical protein